MTDKLLLQDNKKYSLMKCERRYKDKTLVTFYNKKNTPVVKKYMPFDYKGYRYRLNLETGELECYDTKLCKYSLACSVRRTRILLMSLLEMNDFNYFVTFTFDTRLVNRSNDAEVYEKFQNYLDYLKRRFPDLKYVIVPERHKVKLKLGDEEYEFEIEFDDATKGVLHFHMLLNIGNYTEKELGFRTTDKVCCSWAIKKNGIASKEYFERTKHQHTLTITDGLPIYNITKFTMGYTTASKIANKDACKHYVAKYISKCLGLSTSAFKKRFWYTQNLEVPEVVKNEIGAGFDVPVNLKNSNISLLEAMQSAKVVDKNITKYYNDDYNVLQYWFGKDSYGEFQENYNKGLILTNTSTPFDEVDKKETQLKFNID